jgi:hypothetical protein
MRTARCFPVLAATVPGAPRAGCATIESPNAKPVVVGSNP